MAAEKLTLATATGPIFYALAAHASAGVIAIVSGTVAIVATKGGDWHKRSGMAFTLAMISMGILGTVVAAYEGNTGSMAAGTFAAYMVLTATITVRPTWQHRSLSIALLFVIVAYAAFTLKAGVSLLAAGKMFSRGVPVPMILFIGTISLVAAVGDYRFIRSGGFEGSQRLARHLWRMCFGFFVATGSFFIGQMKVIPEPVRNVPVLFALGLAPLPVLLYWMWRVRLRRQLRGMVIAKA